MGIKDFYLATEVLFRPAGRKEGGFGDSITNGTDADARDASATVYPYKPTDRSLALEYNRDQHYWNASNEVYRDEHIYDRSGIYSVKQNRDIEVTALNLLRPMNSNDTSDQYKQGLSISPSTITTPRYNLEGWFLDNDTAGGGWYKDVWSWRQISFQFSAYPQESDYVAVALSYASGFDNEAIVYYFDLNNGTYTRTDSTGTDFFTDVTITPNVNGWYDIRLFGHNEAQRAGNIYPTFLSIHPATDIGDLSGSNASIHIDGAVLTEEPVEVPYIKPRAVLSNSSYRASQVFSMGSNILDSDYSVDYDADCNEPRMILGVSPSANNVPELHLNGNSLGFREEFDGVSISDYHNNSPFVIGDYRMPLGRTITSDSTDSTHSADFYIYQNDPNVNGYLDPTKTYSSEMSIFIKKGTDAYVGFDDGRLGNLCPVFDLDNGTVHVPDSNRVYAHIKDWGNGWWRLYARTLNDTIALNAEGFQEPVSVFSLYIAQTPTQSEKVAYIGSEVAITVSNEQFEVREKPMGDVICMKHNVGVSFGSIGTGMRETRAYRESFTATAFATSDSVDPTHNLNGLNFIDGELWFRYNDLQRSGDYNTGVQWVDGKWAYTYDESSEALRVYANGSLVYSSDYLLHDGSRRGYVGVNAIATDSVLKVKELTFSASVFDADTLTDLTL